MAVRCIVVDDEPLAKMLIESYVRKTPGLELAASYSSAFEGQKAIERGEAPVAFLDIQMPGMSGLQIAREAEKNGVKVIFITAYRDYAIDGFRVNAVDYLLKPVSYEEFVNAVDRVKKVIELEGGNEQESQFIEIRSNYRTVRIPFKDIAYIEGLRDYVKIHLHNEGRSYITQMSLKIFCDKLPEKFVRIHRSYIVDIDFVTNFTRTAVTLRDASGSLAVELPIGATYRKAFHEKMLQEDHEN